MTHPATRELLQSAARQPGFQDLLQHLTRGERGPFSVSGLVTTAKALYLVLLYQATEKPLLVLTDGNKEAETLLESVEVFFDMFFEGRHLPPPLLIRPSTFSLIRACRRITKSRKNVPSVYGACPPRRYPSPLHR